jgi:hypothetical protein
MVFTTIFHQFLKAFLNPPGQWEIVLWSAGGGDWVYLQQKVYHARSKGDEIICTAHLFNMTRSIVSSSVNTIPYF